jgi:hypothetical protein
MGCDIHVYAEYSLLNRAEPYWMTVGGRINPGRDYDLFAKLAGVRTDDPAGQMIPTRGLPTPTSLTVKWDNELYVTTPDGGDEGCCSREDAERYVMQGVSQWMDDKHTRVSQPDWHSHSWCTPVEFRSVLEAKRPEGWGIDPAYFAIAAMLDELLRRDCDARLVFWFDN